MVGSSSTNAFLVHELDVGERKMGIPKLMQFLDGEDDGLLG